MENKMFVVVRADLPPGAQLAQSVHAFTSFAHEFPAIEKRWFIESNNLVCLQIRNEKELLSLAQRAQNTGIACSIFKEPDFNHASTAIALAPEARRIVSNLPLALREPA